VQEIAGNLDQVMRSWYIFAFQIPGIPEWLIQQNLKDFVKAAFQGQAVRKGAFSAEETQIYQTALEKPGVLGAALNYYRQLFNLNSWNWGQKTDLVTAPTLVLWGEDDAFLSKKLTEGLDKLIAAPFQLKLVPHCGHWIQQEAPQTVNRELINFLRGADVSLPAN
jgi:pimeloyl-ACP methyl ester carboxylesterase